MVNIVATLKIKEEKEIIFKRIDNLLVNRISVVRFNLAKVLESNSNGWSDYFNTIKEIVDKYQNRVRIILDIPFPGTKVRIVDKINKDGIGFDLKKDESCIITSTAITEYNGKIIVVNKDITQIWNEGDILFYNDGEGIFNVKRIYEGRCAIIESQSNVTINRSNAITSKKVIQSMIDKGKILHYLNYVAPYAVMMSFVENADDILLLSEKLNCIKIAKVETEKGIRNLENFIEYFDEIMIARGDMAIFSNMYNLCYNQSYIAKVGCKFSKKLYVATDIMTSLINRCIPSRADINDIHNLLMLAPDYIVFNYDLSVSENIAVIKKIVTDMSNIINSNIAH